MLQPLISIIIPCYNGEEYVGEAIESALSQTYDNVEVIVIDDGSTDESLKVLKSFGEAIRWESGPNRGGCAARNRGLELATGEFVQFLDADDLLKPRKLTVQVSAALTEPGSTVYCDYDLVEFGSDRLIKTHSVACDELDPLIFVLRNMRLSIVAPLHPRMSLIQVDGFRLSLQGSQEYDLHLRLAMRDVVLKHIAEPLCTVRQRPHSVSSDYARAIGEQLIFIPDIARELQLQGALHPARRWAFAERLAHNGRSCLQRGAREVGRRFLAEARLIDAAGANSVYAWQARWLKWLAGPVLTERAVALKRNLAAQTQAANSSS